MHPFNEVYVFLIKNDNKYELTAGENENKIDTVDHWKFLHCFPRVGIYNTFVLNYSFILLT